MTNPTFAEAQARLAQRRLDRDAQARARAAAAQASASRLRAQLSSSSAAAAPLVDRALSLWDTLRSREGTRPGFRVGQVDAELLDEELVGLLREQVGAALRYYGEAATTAWSAEILLALRALLFKLTVWDHDATYGAALQNLRYTDARRRRRRPPHADADGPVLVPPSRVQKALYGLVTVGGRYAWTRLEDWLLEQDNGLDEPSPRVKRLARLAAVAESVHAAAACASFLAFLLHGRYRTLLDRVLGMRLAPPTSQVSREVSFEYLNRQLVWHAFTEFLLFVLPLIGINKWRRWLTRTWRKTRNAIASGAAAAAGDDEEEEEEKKGEFSFLPERTCAICYQDQNTASTEHEILAAAASSGVVGSAQTDITNPYETMPCGCVYCFVCLATRIEREEGDGWTCLRCGEVVKECKPWCGDVLEAPSKSPTHNKAVMFAEDVKDASETETSQAEFVDAQEHLGEPHVQVQARRRGSGSGSGESADGYSEEYDEEESELGGDLGEDNY